MWIGERWIIHLCHSLKVPLLLGFLSRESQNECGLLLTAEIRLLQPRSSGVDLLVEPSDLFSKSRADVLAGRAFLELSRSFLIHDVLLRTLKLVTRSRSRQPPELTIMRRLTQVKACKLDHFLRAAHDAEPLRRGRRCVGERGRAQGEGTRLAGDTRVPGFAANGESREVRAVLADSFMDARAVAQTILANPNARNETSPFPPA